MTSKKFLPEDMDLWKQATKDIAHTKKNLEAPKKKIKPEIQVTDIVKKTIKLPSLEVGLKKDISHKQAKQMDQGKLEVEKTLDLHGMTLAQAHISFKKFINLCYLNQKRNLLVITGKGLKSPNRQGKIKQELLEWVNESSTREKILRITLATNKDGGTGAYYILLKRVK